MRKTERAQARKAGRPENLGIPMAELSADQVVQWSSCSQLKLFKCRTARSCSGGPSHWPY